MTDADLLMLENLTYIDDKFHTTTGRQFDLTHYDSLGEFFDDVFTDDVLAHFDAGFGPLACDADNNPILYDTIDGGENSSQEWAAMIRYMKSNDEIRNMRVVDAPQNSNGKTFAMRFEPTPGHAGNTVVAFRGTLDGEEWKDNVDGMIQADTKAQREALDYIESIPSDNITVVGHSKGGNKAQYVAILSDKVKEAVSYDGQGFSKAFIDKYSAEIAKNAKNKIRCYGLDTDFVHGLLYNLPEAKQYSVQRGDDVTEVRQNHSPDAFFTYDQDKEGRWIIVVNPEAKTEEEKYFTFGDEKVKILHRFTNFVMNVAPEEKQEAIVGFVGEFLLLKCGAINISYEERERLQKSCFWYNWSEMSDDEAENCIREILIGKLINSNSDTIGIVLAYFVLYMEMDHISLGEVKELLKELGIDKDISGLKYVINSIKHGGPIDGTLIGLSAEGKTYGLVNGSSIRAAQGEYSIATWTIFIEHKDDPSWWEHVCDEPELQKGRVWDFSEETYNKLMQKNSEIRKLLIPDSAWWSEYSHYRWYSNIDAGGDSLWFRERANQLYEKCVNCESKINMVFDREKEIYKTAIGKLEGICEDLIEARGKLAEKISAVYNV